MSTYEAPHMLRSPTAFCCTLLKELTAGTGVHDALTQGAGGTNATTQGKHEGAQDKKSVVLGLLIKCALPHCIHGIRYLRPKSECFLQLIQSQFQVSQPAHADGTSSVGSRPTMRL